MSVPVGELSYPFPPIDEARQERIDAAARAALTAMLANGERTTSDVRLAREAYDYAEALEAERARRIK